MNSTPGPFDIPLACMKMANAMFHSNLKVMQIMTQTALEAPFAQVRTLRTTASGPAAEAPEDQVATPRKKRASLAKTPSKTRAPETAAPTGRKPRQRSTKPAQATQARKPAAARPSAEKSEVAKPAATAPVRQRASRKPLVSNEKPAPARKRARQPSPPPEMPETATTRKD